MGATHSLVDSPPFAKAFDAAQLGVTARFLNPLYQLLGPMSSLLASESSLATSVAAIDRHAATIIAQKRAEPPPPADAKYLDLVSRYLQVDPTLETSSLRDAVTNFLLAGRDTTAVCLSWSLFELARHPLVHQRLAEEVARVVGPRESAPGYEQLMKQMPYMRAFISEVLRLHPSVPWDPKEATQSVALPSGVVCPQGTTVSWVAYLTGRDAGVWPDPMRFEPMRWVDAEQYNGGKEITQYMFPAFQPGKRSCLGKQLAYAEISFVLCKLCQHGFKFRIPPQIQPTYAVSITLVGSNMLFEISS